VHLDHGIYFMKMKVKNIVTNFIHKSWKDFDFSKKKFNITI